MSGPSRCQVCLHRDLAVLEERLHSGEPHARVARTFGVSRWSVDRHVREHLPPAPKAVEPVITGHVVELEDLDGRLVRLEAVLTNAMDQAVRSGKTANLVAAGREVRQTLMDLARLRGQLADARPVVVNVWAMPEVRELATRLLVALQPWPEARLAAAEALQAGEDNA